MEKMEVPSAQNVGREFVRQYYTMLNEAPHFLHRFYSHNSSFVHGGVEKPGENSTPAIGQAEIHKKIASLNFRDCHAKICQVDSQPSVAGSVVIQVVGELSNNGLPMRRFMQTFVLAPQSPKKYYVHNDIFRYQDEVFHVDENPSLADLPTGSEEYDYGEEAGQQHPVETAVYHQQHGEAAQREEIGVVVMGGEERVGEGVVQPMYYEHEQQPGHYVVSNGDVYPDEVSNPGMMMNHVRPVQVLASADETSSKPAVNDSSVAAAADDDGGLTNHQAIGGDEEEPAVAAAAVIDKAHDESAASEAASAAGVEAVSNNEPASLTVAGSNASAGPTPAEAAALPTESAAPQPKPTWAAMASRNMPAAAAQVSVKPQATIRPEPKGEQTQQKYMSPNTGGALPQRPPRGQQQPYENSVQPGNAATPTVANDRPTAAGGIENGGAGGRGAIDDGGRGQQQPQVYPDNQQVFVGNVPHFITDDDLREYLEVYGPVADVRINRKASNVPNYGFVAFESAETVQKILGLVNSMPLPKLHNKYRINIEEKKPREELNRPRSSTRPTIPPPGGQQGGPGGKPFIRDSYSPRGGMARGGFSNGRGSGGPSTHNGGYSTGAGAYGPSGGGGARAYTRSCSSDDGRGSGGPPPVPATQR